MRRKILKILTVVLIGLAPVAQAQQMNTGLRGMATENDVLAWQAVGRLDAKDIGFCTATLIAPDLVLTAAHCVYSSRTGKLIKADEIMFRAGFRQGQSAAQRPISQIEAHPEYRPRGGMSWQNVRHDVALLRLAEPIPTSELDPFTVHGRQVSRGAVSVVSYGRNRETLPSRQDVCQVVGAQQGIMVLDCDVTFGSSGAPVFKNDTGRGQIVSVISGGGSYDGKKAAFGMSLPKVVAALKHQMWSNRAQPQATIKRVQAGAGARSGGAKFVRP